MKFATKLLLLGAAALVLVLSPAQAQETLYSATGSRGVNGVLYTIDPATAAATPVGQILVGASPIGITGLAFDPLNGVLYGVTGLESPNFVRNLVTINPMTGAATAIGALTGQFGITGLGDISFRSDGTLFGYDGETLYTIDLSTAQLTTVGAAGSGGPGDGLGFSPNGTLYSSNSGAAGTLDTLNPSTGALTTGPALTNAPQTFAMNAFAINSADVLYASNNSQTTPNRTVSLVTINPATGVVTNIGQLPDNNDAIAFTVTIVPEPATWTLIGVGTVFLTASMRLRHRRTMSFWTRFGKRLVPKNFG